MKCSAEIRWFWQGDPPADVETWFRRSRAGGGKERRDVYLIDGTQQQLGVKKRGGEPGVEVKDIEVKGLVGIAATPARLGDAEVSVELWTKWTSRALAIDGLPTLTTLKTRLLRKLDTHADHVREIELGAGETCEDPVRPEERPDVGCNVELTTVTVGGVRWSTLGFESFGPLDAVEHSLRRALDHLADPALELGEGRLALSYPAWLVHVTRSRAAG